MVLLNLIIVQIMANKLDLAKKAFEALEVKAFKNYETHFYLVGVELYKHLQDDYKKKLWIKLAEKNSKAPLNLDHLKN